MGFCSHECYEKARLDGLIKVASWDKMDYLALGREARTFPDKHDAIFARIQENLDRKLAPLTWKHEMSQKEEDIIEC